MLWEIGGGGWEGEPTWEKWRKAPIGDCPQRVKMITAEHCLQRALGLHGQADTQTDVEAFAPYGTTSARHKEQPGHAENRPTK